MKPGARGLALAAFAFEVLFASPAFSIAHWEGDNLNANNPPAQNAQVPNGLKNAIVRVRTFMANKLDGGNSTIASASGCVLLAKQDGPQATTGRVCILTSDHNISVTPGMKFNFWQVGFGNGTWDAPGQDPLPGPPYCYVNNKLGKKDGLQLQMKAKNGKRPDLGILGINLDWNDVPNPLTPPVVKAPDPFAPPFDYAGYGDAGTVDVANRRYTVSSEYGTLRIGTNDVDQQLTHTNSTQSRAGITGEYEALQASMQFDPPAIAPTSADAYILNKDSGGPMLQDVGGDEWRLVGVHSESETDPQNQNLVNQGMKEWDVLTSTYADWIGESVKAVEKMPGTEKKKPAKEKPAGAGPSPVTYDGGLEQLSISNTPMVDTGFPGDPVLSAHVTWPPLHSFATTPTGDFVFDSDSTTRITISNGSFVFLEARVPLVIYSSQSRTFTALLDDLRLAGASPSQPFCDPALVAPGSPWIGALRGALDPASPQYLGGEGLWVDFTAAGDLATVTAGFDSSGSSTIEGATLYADGAGEGGIDDTAPFTDPLPVLRKPLRLDAERRSGVPPLALGPARPDPFSSSTSIAFTLGDRCHARLEILDMSGRAVATIIDRELEAGPHVAIWKAAGGAGAGAYFARLTTPAASATRMIIRLR